MGGCGPVMCGGNLDRDPAELGPMEQEELELLKTTCWCFFAYCFGFGCNSPGGSDACCKVEGKLCCLWANALHAARSGCSCDKQSQRIKGMPNGRLHTDSLVSLNLYQPLHRHVIFSRQRCW